MIDKVSKNIPVPSTEAILKLIRDASGKPKAHTIAEPPEWLIRVVILAYQSGRYDEASSETFAGSF